MNSPSTAAAPVWVNDVHSGLNPTAVASVIVPNTIEDLIETIGGSGGAVTSIALSGCRHAMGGQQFVANGTLIDMRAFNRVLEFDQERGLIRAEAGIQWPELIACYLDAQAHSSTQWGIAQKQTGADTFTLGGSLSANVHGRGLSMRPIIQDVEKFSLLKADGALIECSREENAELFRLAIGGYGLFGIIVDVTLRLVRRKRLERVVEIVHAENLNQLFQQRISQGFLYGDFQFSIDERSELFLLSGVFSCYRPTDRPVPDAVPRRLEEKNWLRLLYLAYTDRARVFEEYAGFYLSTNGQIYWSDTHQLGPYLPDYAKQMQGLIGNKTSSSLLITELYVPGDALFDFLKQAAAELRRHGVIVIYGTVRLIEADFESFLPWARTRSACVIFNLLVEHSSEGIAKAKAAFLALIDLATALAGSFYLTYHRYASADQVRACYPHFELFLQRKRFYDPTGIWQSDWFRHYQSRMVSLR